MSFPRYPKYKASGVAWLGDVPEHWNVLPCRSIVQERTTKNDDAKCQDYLSLMANVGVIPYAEKGDIGNKKPEDLSKCKIVTRGDFVINSMNYGIGSYGLSDYDGVCSSVYIVLKPKNYIVESRFAFRIFESRSFQKFAQSFGNGILEHRSAINWDILKSIGVGIPSLDEQKSVLEFLDRETGKIDELVAEQRRLMELLKEKRQAVISHAVTKGLNPGAPMKPSGIEWLGDVPEDWEVMSLRRCKKRIQTGGTPPTADQSYYEDGTVPWFGPGSFDENLTVSEPIKWLNESAVKEGVARVFAAGATMIVTIGATLGKVSSLVEDGSCNQQITVIEFDPRRVAARFATYQIKRLEPALRAIAPSATLPILGLGEVADIDMVVPPFADQVAIVAHLDTELAKSNTLAAEAQRAIDLLQERRTALISAAVTGQIDVRQPTRN